MVDDLKKINNYKQNASEFRKERDRWVRTFEDMHAFMLSQMKHNEQTI